MKRKGFSLVELLVVLAVMALLAGISVPIVTQQIGKSKANSTRQEMGNLGKSLRAYAADIGFSLSQGAWGRFPAEVQGVGNYTTILGTDLEENTTGSGWNAALRRGWNGPYVSPDQVRTDPDGSGTVADVLSFQVDGWGRYYIYKNRIAAGQPDAERTVTLVSGGPDQDPATTADNITLIVYRGVTY